jgi:hypothetical protein
LSAPRLDGPRLPVDCRDGPRSRLAVAHSLSAGLRRRWAAMARSSAADAA